MINIVNYRVGNLQNIQNAFSTLGFSSQIINNPEELKTAEKIVLPGVGSFGYCMQMIKKYNFDEIIKEKIKQGKILLGICVGMQNGKRRTPGAGNFKRKGSKTAVKIQNSSSWLE